MAMRIAKTIEDVQDLLTDHEVKLAIDGSKVYLLMSPADEKFAGKLYSTCPMPMVGDGSFEGCNGAINFNRTCRNVIRELVASKQFWRCTTVADQMTNFYFADKGPKPAPFISKPDRVPSEKWRMIAMTKKGGEPFTIHFESDKAAKKFVKAVCGT